MVAALLVVMACQVEVQPDIATSLAECGVDLDGDGWACEVDCDDNDGAVNPDAEEICDEIDNDCDGTIDLSTEFQGYADEDGDGYVGADSYSVCHEGLYYLSYDCDETNPLVNYGAPERCDDGIDNNCDGQIDGLGCASWVMIGEDALTGLGYVMDVATADRSLWATLSQGGGDVPPTVRSFLGESGETDFTEAWRYEGGTPHEYAMAVGAWEGRGYLAMVNASAGTAELLEVQEDGTAPTLLASHGLGPYLYSMSLESSTDGLVLAAGSNGQVLMFDDPEQGEASFNDGLRFLVQAASYEIYLGESTLLLPDPGGDGVPELVVIAQRDDYKDLQTNIYLFDGLAEGTVGLDDADAILLDVSFDLAFQNLESAGDLDGDGQVDLAAGRGYFRPLEGEIDGRYSDVTFGDVIAGASIDGDEHIDMVAIDTNYDQDGFFCIVSGPILPGKYDCDSADHMLPFQYGKELTALVVMADVDADGQVELLMGWDGYYQTRVEGVGYIGPGLITAYDIDTWEY